MAAIGGVWDVPWCLCGDFNATKEIKDRSTGCVNALEAREFNCLTDSYCLMEFELENASYTHKDTRGGMS